MVPASGLYKEPFPDDQHRFYQILPAGSGDSVPPHWPASATLIAATVGADSIDLEWSAAVDDTSIVAYALYQDGVHVATVSAAEFSAALTGLDIRGRELGFRFTRTYRSDVEKSGPLGYGWTANVFERLRERKPPHLPPYRRQAQLGHRRPRLQHRLQLRRGRPHPDDHRLHRPRGALPIRLRQQPHRRPLPGGARDSAGQRFPLRQDRALPLRLLPARPRHDSTYRLQSINRPAPTATPLVHSTWQIDGNNNWLQVDAESRQHSSTNEIKRRSSAPGPIAVASDDNGNIRDDGLGLTYQWDAFNRLSAVRQGGTTIARYFYDASGRRVRKVNSNLGPALDGVTEYLYDGTDVIEERGDSAAPLRQFVHGPGTDNPLRLDDLTSAGGSY